MSEYADVFAKLFALAALLLAALTATPLARRVRLPGPAAFLAVGVFAGAVGLAPTEDLSLVTLEQVGAVALYAILFQGGLDTGFRAWRRSARPIMLLGLPGTAATAGALALAATSCSGSTGRSPRSSGSRSRPPTQPRSTPCCTGSGPRDARPHRSRR
jgi:cell volume regulation protein A